MMMISDGSTDNSSIEQEMFFVQYVINGEINVKYAVTQPNDIPDSSSIYSAMKTGLECIGVYSETLMKRLTQSCQLT